MDTVLLTVRCAHQSSADEKVEAKLDWSVLELKKYLAAYHPGKLEVAQQRLIYSGHLLKDSATIRSFLRSYDEEEGGPDAANSGQHVIHLVHTPTVEQLRLLQKPLGRNVVDKGKGLVINRSQTGIGELRQRRTAAAGNAPSGSASLSSTNNSVSANPPGQQQPTSYTMNPYLIQQGAMMGNFSAPGAGLPGIGSSFGAPQPGVPNSGIDLAGTAAGAQTPAISDILQQSQQMYAMYMNNYMSYLAQLYGGAGLNPMAQMGMMVQPMSAHPGYPQTPFGFTPPGAGAPGSGPFPANVPSDLNLNNNTASGGLDHVDGGVQAANGVEPPANNLPAQPQPAPQAEQVMNAQGGVDEEDWRERDWLDWIYVVIRASFLAMILYLYSSWERFLVVLGISVLIYAYQNGWFGRNSDRDARRIVQVRHINNDNNNNIANNVDNAEAAEANNEPADTPGTSDPAASNDTASADTESVTPTTPGSNSPGTSSNEQPEPEEAHLVGGEEVPVVPPPVHSSGNGVPLPYDPDASNWQIFWSTCYTFITSFFASLVPERPPPLN